MKKAVPFLLAALALPACMSADDERKERAEEIEKVYGLKPADARGAAAEKFDLTASQAENDYERVAKALGMKRLFTEDVTAFIDLENKADADRKKILDDLVAPATQDLVKMLRESFQYEPRFKDAEALIAASQKPATFKLACSTETRPAVEAIRSFAPLARFSLASIPVTTNLVGVSKERIEATLKRFAMLEIDLGVQEIDPAIVVLLARCSTNPRELVALQTLVTSLPMLQVRYIEPTALSEVATIPSTALAVTVDNLGRTRAYRPTVSVEKDLVATLKEFARRPQASALLSVLEDADPDYQMNYTLAEVRSLIRLDEAGPPGLAREALVSILRARVQVPVLDQPRTEFLVTLLGKRELRLALSTLHSAFEKWRPDPTSLPALQALGDAGENLGPVCGALRTLGYDISGRVFGAEEAADLSSLAKAGGQDLVNALHAAFPRLTVKTKEALHELEALARAGVQREDVLKLDSDAVKGTLDAAKRAWIVEKAKKAG